MFNLDKYHKQVPACGYRDKQKHVCAHLEGEENIWDLTRIQKGLEGQFIKLRSVRDRYGVLEFLSNWALLFYSNMPLECFPSNNVSLKKLMAISFRKMTFQWAQFPFFDIIRYGQISIVPWLFILVCVNWIYHF